MLQVCDLRSGPVAGEDDLFMPIEKRVERLEEFFLRTIFASEKLDIVDQKKISLAITLPEFDQIAVLDRVDELVDEQFTREVYHLHIFLLRPDVLTNRLHQMRLAETDPAVNEQRVVRARRRLRHGKTRCMRDFVVRTDHERFKRVPWIESRHSCAWLCV